MQNRKTGFTLVELSIVLVIIGLLIGGILVAQSMVNTAKITSTIKQISQFDAAVESFKSEYKYLPGDAPTFGGDGDGAIDQGAGASDQTGYFSCETVNFWANIMPNQFSTVSGCAFGQAPNAPATSGTAKNVPGVNIGKANAFFIVTAISSNGYNTDFSNLANYYVILDFSQATAFSYGTPWISTTSAHNNSSTKPIDLSALDTKIDDGNANSGNVQSGSMGISGGFGCCYGPAEYGPASANWCSNGATYCTSHSGYECTPFVRVGGYAGDPQ